MMPSAHEPSRRLPPHGKLNGEVRARLSKSAAQRTLALRVTNLGVGCAPPSKPV